MSTRYLSGKFCRLMREYVYSCGLYLIQLPQHLTVLTSLRERRTEESIGSQSDLTDCNLRFTETSSCIGVFIHSDYKDYANRLMRNSC